MEIEFDPAKDALNIAKHGLSLARAVELQMADFFEDRRIAYGEVRYIGFGLLDGLPHSLAFTRPRPDTIRAISLRRAHLREYRRYVVDQGD
ncbi:BrnT family toxin [Phenylobacterium aquaticum]|uniref:BrnT family toxin n=1 Tax=Phenylobacterium aquaticum TaxID=1763816 RepID=UPI0026EF3D36|nr:BrnT family toxin [Phenylobacterium aquaticum]